MTYNKRNIQLVGKQVRLGNDIVTVIGIDGRVMDDGSIYALVERSDETRVFAYIERKNIIN